MGHRLLVTCTDTIQLVKITLARGLTAVWCKHQLLQTQIWPALGLPKLRYGVKHMHINWWAIPSPSINYPSRSPLPASQYHGPADTCPKWHRADFLSFRAWKKLIKSAPAREEERQGHYQSPLGYITCTGQVMMMTLACKHLLGLLRKAHAIFTWGEIPSSANLAISRLLGKAITVMQGLEGPKKHIYSLLRQNQTLLCHWWQFT